MDEFRPPASMNKDGKRIPNALQQLPARKSPSPIIVPPGLKRRELRGAKTN
jgi:hypothetical protein